MKVAVTMLITSATVIVWALHTISLELYKIEYKNQRVRTPPKQSVSLVHKEVRNSSRSFTEPDCQWVQWRSDEGDPPGAVTTGSDTHSGSLVYVGRARYGGDLTIGHFRPGSHEMIVPWGSLVHRAANFEVLLGRGFYWSKDYRDGYVPLNAVAGGRTRRGDVLYIGRQRVHGVLFPGPIVTCSEAMFIAVGKIPYRLANYEVLVNDEPSCQR